MICFTEFFKTDTIYGGNIYNSGPRLEPVVNGFGHNKFKMIVVIIGIVLGISLIVMGVSFLYQAIDPEISKREREYLRIQRGWYKKYPELD